MRRTALLISLAAAALATTACLPRADAGPTRLYLDKQANISPVVTPKAAPITWGAAPNIDAHYGGTLYEGTVIAQPDPRPPLLTGNLQPLRLWVADPHNGVTGRPAILWFHGGGFAVGVDSMAALAAGTAKEYAQRGYVGFSVEYRTDTTLVGDVVAGMTRPVSLCQWVQDHQPTATTDATYGLWVQRRDQCATDITAAQHDATAAVRWVRQHAAEYGVDPNRIAVGGFSAGAVMAANVAYASEEVGDLTYFAGDNLSPASSKVQAAFGASGCVYTLDGAAPTVMNAGDAPASMIHSRYDGAVPYSCAAQTATTARSAGLVAELTSYCKESGHANDLYKAHKDATDNQWTTFLARELKLQPGMRAASADPVCP